MAINKHSMSPNMLEMWMRVSELINQAAFAEVQHLPAKGVAELISDMWNELITLSAENSEIMNDHYLENQSTLQALVESLKGVDLSNMEKGQGGMSMRAVLISEIGSAITNKVGSVTVNESAMKYLYALLVDEEKSIQLSNEYEEYNSEPTEDAANPEVPSGGMKSTFCDFEPLENVFCSLCGFRYQIPEWQATQHVYKCSKCGAGLPPMPESDNINIDVNFAELRIMFHVATTMLTSPLFIHNHDSEVLNQVNAIARRIKSQVRGSDKSALTMFEWAKDAVEYYKDKPDAKSIYNAAKHAMKNGFKPGLLSINGPGAVGHANPNNSYEQVSGGEE